MTTANQTQVSKVGIISLDDDEETRKLADALGNELGGLTYYNTRNPEDITEVPLVLTVNQQGLALEQAGPMPNGMQSKDVQVDFLSKDSMHRLRRFPYQRNNFLKAIKPSDKDFHELFIVDATAGFGNDGFLAAWAGATVVMIEQSPVVHALLEDGLLRAGKMAIDPNKIKEHDFKSSTELSDGKLSYDDRVRLFHTLGRITLIPPTNSIDWLRDESETWKEESLTRFTTPRDFTTLYVDDMWSNAELNGKKSAKPKQDIELLQILLADEPASANELLALGREKQLHTIVKHHRNAEVDNDIKPSHQYSGKSTSFSVFVPQKDGVTSTLPVTR